MTSEDRDAIRRQLVRHEGLRLKPYRCTAGYLTIGVGRNLDSNGITEPEAMLLLENDIKVCLEDLAMWPWFQRLNAVRQRALIDMRFQLGSAGFSNFKQMRAALEAGDPALAAQRARLSKWAREQTPARAATVTAMLETGTA
jgi:lysozyme